MYPHRNLFCSLGLAVAAFGGLAAYVSPADANVTVPGCEEVQFSGFVPGRTISGTLDVAGQPSRPVTFTGPTHVESLPVPTTGRVTFTVGVESWSTDQCVVAVTPTPTPVTPTPTPVTPTPTPVTPTPTRPKRPKPKPMNCKRFKATHPGAPAGAYRKRGWKPNCGIAPRTPKPRQPGTPYAPPVTG